MAKKLPEMFLSQNENGEISEQPFAAFVSAVVKAKKVKPLKDENGNEIQSAGDIVKALFKLHLNSEDSEPELEEGMESYSEVSDFLREQVQVHNEALAAQKEIKENEKAAKAQEREAKKAEKEAEDKAYAESQASFEARMMAAAEKHSKKAEAQFRSSIESISLPKHVSFANEGMGLVFADGISKDDLAQATAAVIGGLEGVTNAQSALQFALGDIVNKSISAKIFRTKNEAQEHMRVTLLDKMKKRFSLGAINFYALMSERVAPSKRKVGVAPSVYLAASKIVEPRIKEGTAKEQEELKKKFDSFREETIDQIASGELTSIKDVQAKVQSFKKDAGLLKGTTIGAAELAKRLFFALWVKQNYPNEEGMFTFSAGKDSPETVQIAIGDVSAYVEQAMNELQNIYLKGYNIDALMKGSITKGKGDKEETHPYHMVNPFVAKEGDE